MRIVAAASPASQHPAADAPADIGGLRERKKAATRLALGSAAMRLALEHGLDSVTIEDIAAEAGVSPRTFSNYFASKYEAICSLSLDRSLRVGEELRRRPAAESLWEAIRNAVLAVYQPADGLPDPNRIAAVQMVVSSPALRGEYLKAMSIMQYEMAGAITERTGADPAADTFFTRALAGAVTAVVQAATERWLFADQPMPLVPVIETALRELAEGMLDILPRQSAAAGQPADCARPAGHSTAGPEPPYPPRVAR